MDVKELKAYLRIDITDDDNLLTSLQKAAEGYLDNAGITKDYSNELYKLAIELLVSNWYENRLIASEKALSKIPFGLETIIVQLCCSQSTS